MTSTNIPLEKLLEGSGNSIYKLTILAAKRAMALSEGEKTLVGKPSEKVLDDALREIEAGRIKVREKGKEKAKGKVSALSSS